MTELTVQIEKQLSEFKPFEADLAEFKKRYDGVVYDLTDSKQEKQARSDQYAIGKVVGNLDRKHKEIKAPLAELVKMVDGKRKEIKDDLQSIQGKIKSQIQQHEAKMAEHEEMLKAKFEKIKSLSVFADFIEPASEQIKMALDEAESITIDDSYEHYKDESNIELEKQISQLKTMLDKAKKRESEAAELEKLRKEAAEREEREREERIKAEAAEAARIESERKAAAEIAKIEAEKQQAIIDAENAKREAERQAELAVIQERQRAEREAEKAAEKAKAEQEAIDKKKAQKAHISKVLTSVKKSFINAGFSSEDSKKITELLRDGKVSNAQIIW
ncbi:MAG: hypothetical protein OQK29_01280 [Ignavibacteriaceae bacterium]|nr:hypothetical protein [Ignavibacteriaceae bacterium]